MQHHLHTVEAQRFAPPVVTQVVHGAALNHLPQQLQRRLVAPLIDSREADVINEQHQGAVAARRTQCSAAFLVALALKRTLRVSCDIHSGHAQGSEMDQQKG